MSSNFSTEINSNNVFSKTNTINQSRETNSFIDSGIKFRNAPDSGFNEGEEKKINLWQ
jgi:hypothetical protein